MILDFVKQIKKNNIVINKNDKSYLSSGFNMLKLAYIGDSLYEIFIRDYILNEYVNKFKMKEIHKKVINLVCASMQARIVEKMLNDNFLDDEDILIFKNARNTHNLTKSKNSSIIDYRKATGFEAILGYYYFNNNFDKMNKIFEYIKLNFL